MEASSFIFENITETTSKHAKLIQKEYEALNEHCARYFRRVAKEEKAHDELLDTLDSKVKKAHAGHEKNVKRSGRGAIDSHDKYIQTVQGLTQDISRAKVNHSSSVGTKTFVTSLVVASTLGGMADSEFKSLCESVRRSGPHIGKLNEWLNFASTEGMRSMKPVDLSDDAMGWAQVLAIKEAEIREEFKKQEKARLAQLEHTQALLKAQQMGWTPPSQQSRQPTDSSPSHKGVSEAGSTTNAPNTSASTSTSLLANLPRLDSQGQLVETPSRPAVSRSVSSATDTRSESVSGTGQAAVQRLAPPATKSQWGIQEEEEEETQHPDESSIAEGTVIDREETAARAETKAANAASSKATTVLETAKTPSPSESPTSAAMPTNAPRTTNREDSDATPSLIASTSNSKGSEDSNGNIAGLGRKSFGPTTPTSDGPGPEVVVEGGTSERIEGILKRPGGVDEGQPKAERPLDRYMDGQAQKQQQATIGRGFPESQQQQQQGGLQRDDSVAERTRKLSLWEHERERERQLERESELQRRLMDAEDRLRNIKRDEQAAGNGYRREDVTSQPVSAIRPRYSEPARPYAAQASRYDEEIPAQRYEPERYAPAVGTSRLSGVSVNRSMSTDSERSFVARMKAKYQAEKEEREGRATPTTSSRHIPTSPRKVSDMALAFGKTPDNYGGYTYDPIASSSQSSRGRYDSAPARSVDVPRSMETTRPGDDYREAHAGPHSISCGCWSCSARHYGASASMTKPKPSGHPPPPPPRHPAAHGPPTHRRQSLPPPKDERSSAASLAAPPHRQVYPRRSFEEDQDRRVAFSNTYQTIR